MGRQKAKQRREKNRKSREGNDRAASVRRAEIRAAKAAEIGCEMWQSCPRAKRDACTPPKEECLLRLCVMEAEQKVKL